MISKNDGPFTGAEFIKKCSDDHLHTILQVSMTSLQADIKKLSYKLQA